MMKQSTYQDYANLLESDSTDTIQQDDRTTPGNFPEKLHYVLQDMEKDCLENIASWQTHGRCFVVHDTKRFEKEILPL